MKKEYCRIGKIYGKEGMVVCKHIKIDGRAYKADDEGCEYHEELNITCSKCRKVYGFTVLIN